MASQAEPHHADGRTRAVHHADGRTRPVHHADGRTRPVQPLPAADRAPTGSARVFVADAHEVIRLGLELLLGQAEDLELVGTTGSASEVIQAAIDDWADILLVDAGLDGVDGRHLAPAIAATGTRARVCYLLDDPDPYAAAMLARCGASGVLHKRASGRHLVEALRRLPTESFVVDPAVASSLMKGVLEPPDRQLVGQLSVRDRELLRLLGEGRTNREIAETIYLSEKTVKNYLSSLFRKLGVRSRTEAALWNARHQPHLVADPAIPA